MSERNRVALLIGGAGLLALALLLVTARIAHAVPLETALLVAMAAAALMAIGLLGLWRSLDRGILDPLAGLGRDLAALVESRRIDRTLLLPEGHRLERLAQSLGQLIDRLRSARRECDDALAIATAHIAEQKTWLEVILLDLSEGVVVCSSDHRILLYNQAAIRLLERPDSIGLSRPLFALVTREPVLHALTLLNAGGQMQGSIPFVCATTDASRLLQGRVAVVRGQEGGGGYVISLADATREVEALERDNALRRAITRDLRHPIANLRAAAETIAAYPGMTPRERAAFDEVVAEECAILSERIETLEADFRRQSEARWLMADISSLDLFNCLARDCADDRIGLSMVGIPLWLHGDSHSLLVALRTLVARLRAATGLGAFDAEALLADHHVYLDFSWKGEPVAAAILESWLDDPLDAAAGTRSLRDVLDHHGSEPWSQRLPNSAVSVLRIPLPAPLRPQFSEADSPRTPRPEFYDFDLMRTHCDGGALNDRRLSDLTYVVFDCETTGLKPSEGDAIVQIGAVRVLGRRVLTGEAFERLVHPGRPIPPDSTRFHGITDDMVRTSPPIGVVLPQFAAFAGDAVLVGHNAAFDLKFLATQEADTGIRFNGPVLDTLLLAALVDPEADHSLEAVARRLGVTVESRHSALSDALMTAEVMVRLFDRLEARGLHTFGDVMRASGMAAEIHTRQRAF
jgi:DNA polymerase-3 subunit epsilon